uniref:Uncharacterized protein n=1 Tax=Glossina pallidipes TaxID=7398 RepID=A0A1A9Z4C8_GLOPL
MKHSKDYEFCSSFSRLALAFICYRTSSDVVAFYFLFWNVLSLFQFYSQFLYPPEISKKNLWETSKAGKQRKGINSTWKTFPKNVSGNLIVKLCGYIRFLQLSIVDLVHGCQLQLLYVNIKRPLSDWDEMY